ncbi:hypothetical protein scyTo_0012771, partial [Scyliorhinus torazame]|nr:hypothetical protein [Scyliorhinus torazame]
MLETKRTLVLVLEMCSNEGLLDHLFRKNIVAETKPANILMVHPERDDVKICDFGFAQEFSPIQPQFSKYGCPEFVAPEIVSQDPISTATDIWAVGVITFLCLTGSSPFAGENDRATLMNVKEGSFSWDERDRDCISKDAQNFITRIIRIIPQDRPTASESLQEQWFQEKLKLQESCMINTRKLKFFISRSKWQDSLMSYKTILAMKSIPQLMEEPSKGLSLGLRRHSLNESSSPTTSASSSDFEDYTHQTEPCSTHTPDVSQALFDQCFANEGEYFETPQSTSFSTDIIDPNISEHKSDRPLSTRSIADEKQADVKYDLGAEYEEDMKAQHKYSETCDDLNLSARSMKHPISKAATLEMSDYSRVEEKATHNLVQGISADSAISLQLSGPGSILDTGTNKSPRLLPRHCLIKSTFSSDTLENRDISTGDTKYARSLERTRKRFVEAGYTKGKVSGLRQPLLECFQMSVQGRRSDVESFGEISSHISRKLARSTSYDDGSIVAYSPEENSRRSKSLDECEAENLAQTIAKKSVSEILEPFPQQSDPNSSTMSIVHDALAPQPVSLDALESATQQSGMCKYILSDIVCLSEEGTFLTELKYISECPTKNIPSEIAQSVQTNAASLHLSEKETNMELNTERKTCITDIKDTYSQHSEVDSSEGASHPSPSDLQTRDCEFSQSSEDTESSPLSEPPELESRTTERQYYDEPTNSHSDVSEVRPCGFQLSMDPELESEISSVAASAVTFDPQEQSSSENVGSLYFNAVDPGADYFDLSEPYGCGLEYEHSQKFEERSTSQAKNLPVPWTSEEPFPSREMKTKKGSPLQGKLDQTSTSSYEILCDETETANECSWNLNVDEWDSDLLELLKDSEDEDTTSDIGEGESKNRKKSKRSSLENKIHQSFESLRKAFKNQKDAKSPIASSETSLTGSERHTDPLSKSSSETFGSSSLLRLFGRSASLNWDKGLHQLDEGGGRSQYSLSVLRDLNSSKYLQNSRGARKSQTLPVRFSWQMKSKEKPKLRERKEKDVSKPQENADPSRTELHGNQYMEVMKVPLIPPLKEFIDKRQMSVQSTDSKDNPSGFLKKKSRLFSFKLPSSKAKEKGIADESPSFLEDLINQSVVLSQSVTLSCRPSGYPNPDILWFKGDEWKNIASDLSESCFYASNLRRGETYTYRVAYVNKAGNGQFSRPSAEVIIGETEVESHSVHGEKLASVHQTYTFFTEINRGRFGIIKKCTENSSRKSLAAKITPYKKQNKPFVLKEYEILKKLHHNNIVQLHGAYITPKYLVLIQELCEGKELFHNLAERSSYTEHHVVELLTQMLSAVEYLHLNHTLHLDLKSENMIIVEHNVLKLLDFGNAVVLMPGRPVLVEKCRDFVENM